MIVETAQILCTAHRVLDEDVSDVFYKKTHVNHPSSVWARSSTENYDWLVEHLHGLGREYTHRYGKTHATITRLGEEIRTRPRGLTKTEWSDPPCAMADEFIVSDDPVENYRNYYVNGKAHLHRWKDREPPEWIDHDR